MPISRPQHRHTVFGILLAAGCAATACAPPRPITQPPHPTFEPDRAPETICTEFTRRALTIDHDHDARRARHDAAVQFGTASLQQRLAGSGRDPDAERLREHGGHLDITTTPVLDDAPPPHAGRVGGAVRATRRARIGHRRFPLPPVILYCTLRRIGHRWRVAEFTIASTTGAAR